MNDSTRPYRYDGKDEDGQHWGEYLDADGEPTEQYFRMVVTPEAPTCKCSENYANIAPVCNNYEPGSDAGGDAGNDGAPICRNCEHDFSCHAPPQAPTLAEAATHLRELINLADFFVKRYWLGGVEITVGYETEQVDSARAFLARIEATQ